MGLNKSKDKNIKRESLWRRSTEKFRAHKRGSISVIIIFAVVCGLAMMVNSLVSGLQKTLMEVSVAQTGGKPYIETSFKETVFDDDRRLDEQLERYQGEKLGKLTMVQLNRPVLMVDQSVVKDFITSDLEKVPENKVPVLMPADYREIEDGYYVVGTFPTTKRDMSGLALAGSNPLNLVLGFVSGNLPIEALIVRDGSGKAEKYLADQTKEWQKEQETENEEPRVRERVVARFKDVEDLAGYSNIYTLSEFAKFEPVALTAQSLFGNATEVLEGLRVVKLSTAVIEILVLLVLIVIMAIVLGRILRHDTEVAEKSRSKRVKMGNSRGTQILYLLEVMTLAVVGSVVVAVVGVVLIAMINNQALGEMLQEFYLLEKVPSITWWGIDWRIWMFIGAVVAIVPLAWALGSYQKVKRPTKYYRVIKLR